MLVITLFSYQFDTILTNQGCEFKKKFTGAVKLHHKNHWHTYPRTPKMNAHYKRFNRTLQEEYLDYHIDDLIDLASFNQGMAD